MNLTTLHKTLVAALFLPGLAGCGAVPLAGPSALSGSRLEARVASPGTATIKRAIVAAMRKQAPGLEVTVKSLKKTSSHTYAFMASVGAGMSLVGGTYDVATKQILLGLKRQDGPEGEATPADDGTNAQ